MCSMSQPRPTDSEKPQVEIANKSTYPALMGVERARERAQTLVDDGCAGLRAAGLLSTELDALARFVVERES